MGQLSLKETTIPQTPEMRLLSACPVERTTLLPFAIPMVTGFVASLEVTIVYLVHDAFSAHFSFLFVDQRETMKFTWMGTLYILLMDSLAMRKLYLCLEEATIILQHQDQLLTPLLLRPPIQLCLQFPTQPPHPSQVQPSHQFQVQLLPQSTLQSAHALPTSSAWSCRLINTAKR